MTITIFGANTIVGKQLIKRALAKNFKVKAFDRNIEFLIDADLRNDAFEAIKGYVFDKNEVLKAVKKSDVIVSCLEGSIDGIDKTRSLGMKNIIEAMQKANVKKIVAISGIGILNYAEDKLVMEMDDFPLELKAVSLEYLLTYEQLQATNLNWTLVCTNLIIDKDFTGDYNLTENYLTHPITEKNYSGDIADCILKTVINGTHTNSRIEISMKN